MAGIAGKLIGIKVNGAFISCEVSCEINFDREMLSASAVDSGGWKEYIAGIRGWSLSVNGKTLMESVGADIKSILTSGYFGDLPMYAQFSTKLSGSAQMVFSGNVLLPSAQISAPQAGNSTWTANLQGNGKLTNNLQDLALLIDAMPEEADYPTIVDQDVI